MHPLHFEQQYHSFHNQGTGAAPGGQGMLESALMVRASGADANPYKRQKTTAERKAEKDAKAARLAAEVAQFDPSMPFALGEKQPWAGKAREVAELTDEQKEYIAQVRACLRASIDLCPLYICRPGASTRAPRSCVHLCLCLPRLHGHWLSSTSSRNMRQRQQVQNFPCPALPLPADGCRQGGGGGQGRGGPRPRVVLQRQGGEGLPGQVGAVLLSSSA